MICYKLRNIIYLRRNYRLSSPLSEDLWYYILGNFYDLCDPGYIDGLTEKLIAVFPYYKGKFRFDMKDDEFIFYTEPNRRLKKELEFLLSHPPMYTLDNKDYQFTVKYGLPRSYNKNKGSEAHNEN